MNEELMPCCANLYTRDGLTIPIERCLQAPLHLLHDVNWRKVLRQDIYDWCQERNMKVEIKYSDHYDHWFIIFDDVKQLILFKLRWL